MQTSSITSNQTLVQPDTGKMAQFKQAFQTLDSALESGDLTAARDAYAQIQKNAPARAGNQAGNPLQQQIEILGNALEAGDVQAARDALADVKTTMSQRPAGAQRGQGGRPAGGPPPGGGGHMGGASRSSSSSETYDLRDTNKDGKVSAQEELAYRLKQLAGSTEGTTSSDNQDGLDVLA